MYISLWGRIIAVSFAFLFSSPGLHLINTIYEGDGVPAHPPFLLRLALCGFFFISKNVRAVVPGNFKFPECDFHLKLFGVPGASTKSSRR
jgi:hypothetical protein